MKILILEDDKRRQQYICEIIREQIQGPDFYVTDTVPDMIRWLKSQDVLPDLIFLDHDLAGQVMMGSQGVDMGTGWYAAKFIGEHPEIYERALVIIHSLNSPGARNMQALIPGSILWPVTNFKSLDLRNMLEQKGS